MASEDSSRRRDLLVAIGLLAASSSAFLLLKLIPESMAMYQAGRPTFRKASKPEPEARLWMLEGFAGTLQPWWHYVGAYQEDRRQYRTAEPINRWHEAHQE
jgi:hypothetical protein